jgi:hypothetical protein
MEISTRSSPTTIRTVERDFGACDHAHSAFAVTSTNTIRSSMVLYRLY